MSLIPEQTQLEQDEALARRAIESAAQAFSHAAAVLNRVDSEIAGIGIDRALALLNANKAIGKARVDMLAQAGKALNAIRAASGLPQVNPAPEKLSLHIAWDDTSKKFIDVTPSEDPVEE